MKNNIEKNYVEKNYKDVYGVLDHLRQRPAMYLGNKGRKSFVALIAFMLGLAFAEVDGGEPSFYLFIHWIAGRVKGMSSTMPWEWMEEEWGNDQAFDRFFELLDEYRTCERVCVSRAILREHQPKFYYQESFDGELLIPEKPLEVCITQFAPSAVYCLLEIYIGRQEDYIPYQRTIDEVKALTESRWGVSKDEWFDF